MFKKLIIKCVDLDSKSILTNITRYSSEAVNVSKQDYYKNLQSKNLDAKPAGWDEALPFKDIPGPKPLPLLGNVWRFLPLIGEFYDVPLSDLHKMLRDEYGKIIQFKGIPGRDSSVFIYDTDDIEKFLRNAGPYPIRFGMESFIYYRSHNKQDVFNGVGGILTVQGEEWFKFRSIVNPILMKPRTTQQYVGGMNEVASELIDNIRYFSKENKENEMPESFLNELYKWALESMGHIALDTRLGCLKLNQDGQSEGQKLISGVIEMFELMYKLDVLPPIWKFYSTPSWKKFVKIMDFITDITEKYVEQSLNKANNENESGNDLSVLQQLSKRDKQIATTMVIDMLIAGIDTTGRVMAAALYFMAKNPDKQKLLRQELRKNLPNKDSPITNEVLTNSPYLKAVIKETLRISPVALGTLRTTIKDMVLSGYKIPKGTEVISMHLSLSNSPEFFKDPEKFIPERWLRTTTDEFSYKNANPFAYSPFGFGNRSCVGKRFANLELETGLSKVIRNFELSWPHEDMVFSGKFLYGVSQPLKLRIKEYNDNL